MWRRGLPLPGLRCGFERQHLEFDFELPGCGVTDELEVGCSQFFPGHQEIRVAEDRQEAASHDPRLDDNLISCGLSYLNEAAVRAHRLHRGGPRNPPNRIEHDMELTAAGLADTLRQALGLLQVDGCVRTQFFRSSQAALVACAGNHAPRSEQAGNLNRNHSEHAAGCEDQDRLALLQLSAFREPEECGEPGRAERSGHAVRHGIRN